MIDWLPHVAEAPAALYADPWGRARADALWRRADAEEGCCECSRATRGRRRHVAPAVDAVAAATYIQCRADLAPCARSSRPFRRVAAAGRRVAP